VIFREVFLQDGLSRGFTKEQNYVGRAARPDADDPVTVRADRDDGVGNKRVEFLAQNDDDKEAPFVAQEGG
ncbi:unnamed protein product, partial [Amoebophrya sp. A120]